MFVYSLESPLKGTNLLPGATSQGEGEMKIAEMWCIHQN